MVEIILDKEYTGPDIHELAPVIPDITDKVIKVRWTNTKDEIRTLRQFKRKFQLYVPDSQTFDRAVATFGKRLKVASGTIERAKLMLRDKTSYDWRRFSEEVRDVSLRYVLMQIAADAIRSGKQPALTDIVSKVFVDGISPVDADVLLRLKSNRIRG